MSTTAAIRVLVVDDDAENAEAMREYLTLRGLLARVAPTGEAALLALAEGPRYDVVVTDLRLPGIQGEQLARRLRAEGPGAPKLVALSGDAPERSPCFDLCLAKPCRPRLLVEAILSLVAPA